MKIFLRAFILFFIIFLFIDSSFSKEKILILKPANRTAHLTEAEILEYHELNDDLYVNILNLFVANFGDEYDFIGIDSVVTDVDKARALAKKNDASIVLFGSVRYHEEKIYIHLKLVRVLDGKLIYNYIKVADNEDGYLTPLTKFKVSTSYSWQIGIELGYPITFGYFYDVNNAKISFPLYIGMKFKSPYFYSQFFTDIEIGFLSTNRSTVKANVSFGEDNTLFFPISLSLGYDIFLMDNFSISPKLGLGYMLAYSTTTRTSVTSPTLSSFILIKSGIESKYRISQDWLISISGQFLIANNVQGSFFIDTDYYIIPSAGVHYEF